MRKSMFVVGLALIVALAGVPAVWAASHSLETLAWNDEATGMRIQFITIKNNDWVRGNQVVTYAVETDRVAKGDNGKYAVKEPTMVAHDGAQSTGIVNGFMQQGFAGIMQGGGLVGGMALLRPSSNTNIGNNQPYNSNAQNQAMRQRQAQGQFQLQGQNQGNVNTFVPTNVNAPTNVNTALGGNAAAAAANSNGPFSPANATAIAP